MTTGEPEFIRFRGREERIIQVFSVRGRRYLGLEQLSRRGAFRVYDRHAGPGGDYRVLYKIPFSRVTQQRIETLRKMCGPTVNRNFPYISDCSRQGNELYVVMQWVWGESLRRTLRKMRDGELARASVWEAVRLSRGLAHGLAHFHSRSHLVHGDVSPANIIVTTGTKQLVLIDFGSAWPLELAAVKETGDGVTVPYAAPERIAQHALEDFRSDAFSLSIVAYEIMTLEIPYDGLGGRAGLPGVVHQFQDSFVPPSQRVSRRDRLPISARGLLDELFRVSLALHPDHRFATRRDWLRAWDQLHFALRPGGRLTALEHRVVRCLEYLVSRFRRD